MSVKILWTDKGQILADVTETDEGYSLENPVFISPGGQGVQMLPVLMFTEEKKLTVTPEEICFNGQLFEPLKELRNHYTSQFGAGIQLLT